MRRCVLGVLTLVACADDVAAPIAGDAATMVDARLGDDVPTPTDGPPPDDASAVDDAAGDDAGIDLDGGGSVDGGDPFWEPIVFDDTAIGAIDPSSLFQADAPCRMPVRARVDRAVDGDTLAVTLVPSGDDERVRIIGVNAPEIAHGAGEMDQCFGPEAHTFTRQLQGRQVWLTFDRLCVDPYQRTLAFVHIGAQPGAIWARQLVRRGLGRAYVIGRNRAIEADITADEREARARSRGLWGACP